MADSTELLRLQVLLRFYREGHCTVTGLAKEFGLEKYTISRLLSALEEEGLVDRSNNRHPKLTSSGFDLAATYSEKVDSFEQYLLQKGISSEVAAKDSMELALHVSKETSDLFAKDFELEESKFEFKDRRKFAGSEIFSNLPDGNYKVSFIIYREKANSYTNVSMVNEGFEHPCILSVEDGKGTIRLRLTTLNARSSKTGEAMKGTVTGFKYFKGGTFVEAETNGEFITFPTESFQIYNLRPGYSPLLHGLLPVKVTASVGNMYMPESTAFFCIIF